VDHYETLGVARDAKPEEIKKAYRKRAKNAHPDRNGGADAAMSAINVAYEILMDPKRRLNYDRTGTDGNYQDIQAQARGNLAGRFVAWLNNEAKTQGMIEEIRFGLEQEIGQLSEGKKVLARIVKQSRGKLARLKFKGKGVDPLRIMLEYHLTGLEKQSEQAQDKLDVLTAMRTLLEEYEFEGGVLVTPTQQPQMFYVKLG
jgi:DnaJ-class molecular chaperone